MLKMKLWNLQLFGEGDGGDGGSATESGDAPVVQTSGEEIPAFIPEKAKKYYKKAMEKSAWTETADPSKADVTEPNPSDNQKQRLAYADLIKSDEYKDEHKAYMDKTIGDRLKKYKGMEDKLSKSSEILDIIATKYGISPDDENFLDVLKEKAQADDSYYEQYAMEHDVSPDEARRIVTMERKVKQIESEKAQAEKDAQMQEQVRVLRMNAEKTKAQFPQFDLETELQDERFRRLCFTNNGDTTAAYMACHWNEILPNTVQMATKQAKQQTVNAIASGQSRPVENGMSSSPASVVASDFKNMSLAQLRDYAARQRRQTR